MTGVAVAVGVSVGSGVFVGVLVGVSVGVKVGSGVLVGVSVGVKVGHGVLVGVAVGVKVGHGVFVDVGVGDGGFVDVAVGSGVFVGVLVGNGVLVGVGVNVRGVPTVSCPGIIVGVGVRVGVGEDATTTATEVLVGVAVGGRVGVRDGVRDGVSVGVRVGVALRVPPEKALGVLVGVGSNTPFPTPDCWPDCCEVATGVRDGVRETVAVDVGAVEPFPFWVVVNCPGARVAVGAAVTVLLGVALTAATRVYWLGGSPASISAAGRPAPRGAGVAVGTSSGVASPFSSTGSRGVTPPSIGSPPPLPSTFTAGMAGVSGAGSALVGSVESGVSVGGKSFDATSTGCCASTVGSPRPLGSVAIPALPVLGRSGNSTKIREKKVGP